MEQNCKKFVLISTMNKPTPHLPVKVHLKDDLN